MRARASLRTGARPARQQARPPLSTGCPGRCRVQPPSSRGMRSSPPNRLRLAGNGHRARLLAQRAGQANRPDRLARYWTGPATYRRSPDCQPGLASRDLPAWPAVTCPSGQSEPARDGPVPGCPPTLRLINLSQHVRGGMARSLAYSMRPPLFPSARARAALAGGHSHPPAGRRGRKAAEENRLPPGAAWRAHPSAMAESSSGWRTSK